MRPSRVRTLQFVAAGGLALLAVRPVGPLEGALDWLMLPARVLAELAGPLGWIQARDVYAADGQVLALRRAEIDQQERLEQAVLRMASPEDAVLRARLNEAHGLRAEVVSRPDGDLDRLLVRVADPAAVTGDLPVVSGDVFVGRVDLLATRDDAGLPADLLVVRLVTEADFRIGAEVLGSDCRLVVGGLAALAATRLDVHNPSDRTVERGAVVVREPAFAEGRADLANGFHLGALVCESSAPGESAQRVRGVVPGLDYATGLHQVLILLPPGASAPREAPRGPLLEDGRWAPARLFLRGEVSARRFGRKLALGWSHGVDDGAALASGARFAGRVLHAGVAGSDAALLGDPGLTVPALALIAGPGGERVHVLGRLTCLGRRGDRVLVRWPASLPLDPARFAGPTVEARLWTGSGEAGVPRGLLLGDARLPLGPGPHVLEVRLPADGLEPKGLVARLREEGAE